MRRTDMKQHWILMYASAGCLPDYIDVYERKGDALESARTIFEISRREQRELARDGYLTREEWVLYSLQLTDCDCDTPWIHSESQDVYSIGEWLEVLNKGARYEVIETFHDFTVYDNETGEAHGMGDGVGDVIVLPDCPYTFSLQKNGQYMAAAWTYVFNRDDEAQEAYFG
jgi:hypothetical protein